MGYNFWTKFISLCLIVLHRVDFSISNELDKQFIKVCRGTNYKRTVTSFSTLDKLVYNDLKSQFENCTHVVGNLELINIPDRKTDLSFLQHIRQVTGYINFQNVSVPKIVLPNLEVIHGKDLMKDELGYATFALALNLQLVLPELKAILNGEVKLYVTLDHEPCYFDTLKWGVIVKKVGKKKLDENNRNLVENKCKCDPSCIAGCWDEGPKNCQYIQNFTCSLDCNERGCFGPSNEQCCHANCVGGCTGPSNAECLACKHALNDGLCKDKCPAGSYSAHGICVKSCPAGLFRDDDLMECLLKCPKDKEEKENVCFPCALPTCKICSGSSPYDEFIYGINVKKFQNCTILVGNLEFNDSPHQYTFWNIEDQKATIYITIPPSHLSSQAQLFASNLRLLSSIRKITGSFRIDNIKNEDFKSLAFLHNLEEIGEGLSITRTNIKALNLRSLKNVRGGIEISNNPNLCFASGINWSKVSGGRDVVTIENNANRAECAGSGEVCSDACQISDGCWGIGSENCLTCKRYLPNSTTCEEMDCKKIKENPDDPRNDLCILCHSTCLECDGPGPGNCTSCASGKFLNGGSCVENCPEGKFESEMICVNNFINMELERRNVDMLEIGAIELESWAVLGIENY